MEGYVKFWSSAVKKDDLRWMLEMLVGWWEEWKTYYTREKQRSQPLQPNKIKRAL